jgi:hypothetical protein
MAQILIIVVGILYFFTAIGFLYQSNYWMALVYISYALSNVGLYFIALQGN